VRIWDPSSGKELRGFLAHAGPVLALAFGPDGKTLVSGSADRTLKIFDVESGRMLEQYIHDGEVRAVAASGDSHYFFAGPGSEILDWRFEAAASLRVLSGHADLVHAVAFAPDGKTAASGSADGTVRIWNVAEGKEERSISAHGSSVFCVAFSPDGKTVASGGFDNQVKLWQAAGGSLVKEFKGHEEGVFCLAFSPDGEFLLSGSSDRTIRSWSIREGKEARVFREHSEWISDLKFFPGKGSVVSVDYGGDLLIWSPGDGKVLSRRRIPAIVHALALSADGGLLATANQDGSIFLYEASAMAP
jgi:WD40 repeat protein